MKWKVLTKEIKISSIEVGLIDRESNKKREVWALWECSREVVIEANTDNWSKSLSYIKPIMSNLVINWPASSSGEVNKELDYR